jgi:hypothetical protein
MRELHVFFLYYAYPLFAPVAHQIPKGHLIMEAMAHLLLALNLVKGFSMQVFNFPVNSFLYSQKYLSS